MLNTDEQSIYHECKFLRVFAGLVFFFFELPISETLRRLQIQETQ